MRLLVCFLLLGTSASAKDGGELRLWFHDSQDYFELDAAGASVRLLQYGRDSGHTFDFARQSFHDLYGVYTLIIQVDGFKSYSRQVLVVESKVDVLVNLRIGEIADHARTPPPTLIKGNIVASGVELQDLWVRIQPLAGGSLLTFDERVDRRGRFSVAVDSSREFHVLVLAPGSESGLRLLATKQVRAPLYRTTEVEIEVE